MDVCADFEEILGSCFQDIEFTMKMGQTDNPKSQCITCQIYRKTLWQVYRIKLDSIFPQSESSGLTSSVEVFRHFPFVELL